MSNNYDDEPEIKVLTDILVESITNCLSKYQSMDDCNIDDYACTTYHGYDKEAGIDIRFRDPDDFLIPIDDIEERLLEIVKDILKDYKDTYWYDVEELEAVDKEMNEEIIHEMEEDNIFKL